MIKILLAFLDHSIEPGGPPRWAVILAAISAVLMGYIVTGTNPF